MSYICHSSRPFCTRHVPGFGLVGRMPGPVQDVIQAGRSVRPPSPGKVSAPLRMRVDMSSYAGACVVRPPKKPYKRRHIGLSQ